VPFLWVRYAWLRVPVLDVDDLLAQLSTASGLAAAGTVGESGAAGVVDEVMVKSTRQGALSMIVLSGIFIGVARQRTKQRV
jgi:hypothetical protein